jgi:acetyltransferase-like isoleucine patch superfamily enzyme
VTKDIPDGISTAGVPAKPIRTVWEYVEKISNIFILHEI